MVKNLLVLLLIAASINTFGKSADSLKQKPEL